MVQSRKGLNGKRRWSLGLGSRLGLGSKFGLGLGSHFKSSYRVGSGNLEWVTFISGK